MMTGVARASDPLTAPGKSVATHRSKLTYAALRRTVRLGQGRDAFKARMRRHLERDGVNPDAPHANLPVPERAAPPLVPAADAPTAAGPADPASGSAGPFVEVGLPDGGAGVRLFGGGGVWHVWVGLVPDEGLMDRLVVSAGTVVVHGHGVGGGLGLSAGVAEALEVAKGQGVVQGQEVVQALVLACEQTGAQSFATGHGIAVEATRESVFVSPRDGGLFFGQAQVGADGRLTVVTRAVPSVGQVCAGRGWAGGAWTGRWWWGCRGSRCWRIPGRGCGGWVGRGGWIGREPAVEGEPVGQGPPPPVTEEPFAEAPVERGAHRAAVYRADAV